MENPINVATRPTRLSFATHIIVLALLGLSFVSGATIWYGQNANSLADPRSARFDVQYWRSLHGALNPFLCVLFGFLAAHHVRVGWQIKANRWSGLLMELVFAILILTGMGIYYSPEHWQDTLIQFHRVIGLFVPLSLAIHWIAARQWVKKVSQK